MAGTAVEKTETPPDVSAAGAAFGAEQFSRNPALQKLLAAQDFSHVEDYKVQVGKADLFEGSAEFLYAELEIRLQKNVFGPLRENFEMQRSLSINDDQRAAVSEAHTASLSVVADMKDELEALKVHKLAKVLKLRMLDDIKNAAHITDEQREVLKQYVLQETINAKRSIETSVFSGLDFSQITTRQAIEGTRLLYDRLLEMEAEVMPKLGLV